MASTVKTRKGTDWIKRMWQTARSTFGESGSGPWDVPASRQQCAIVSINGRFISFIKIVWTIPFLLPDGTIQGDEHYENGRKPMHNTELKCIDLIKHLVLKLLKSVPPKMDPVGGTISTGRIVLLVGKHRCFVGSNKHVKSLENLMPSIVEGFASQQTCNPSDVTGYEKLLEETRVELKEVKVRG